MVVGGEDGRHKPIDSKVVSVREKEREREGGERGQDGGKENVLAVTQVDQCLCCTNVM